jgi:hypothetical protein
VLTSSRESFYRTTTPMYFARVFHYTGRGIKSQGEQNPCAGYLDHPFLKNADYKKATRCSENKLADRVCLSRWASCGSSDARRFRCRWKISTKSLPTFVGSPLDSSSVFWSLLNEVQHDRTTASATYRAIVSTHTVSEAELIFYSSPRRSRCACQTTCLLLR